MTSYSVRNALVRRNKEIVDEEKRREWPFYTANKRVFDMERKDIMDEVPRTTVSVETFQENSLLANLVKSALSTVSSTIDDTYFTGLITGSREPDFSSISKLREALVNYLNNIQFKIIPSINTSKNISLITSTFKDLDSIYRQLVYVKRTIDGGISYFDEVVRDARRENDDVVELRAYSGLHTLEVELGEINNLIDRISTIRGTLQSYPTNAITKDNQYQQDEVPELKVEEVKDNLPDVNEAFQEDQNLDELGNEEQGEDVGAGYDPISQQKSQFEAGEKRFRDEVKQDEDDLEGMGLRFRLAKTKNKKR